jgi:NAD(P)-dependent dehydrogenase (short-subunit alcohol dehydrogenase family)
MSRLKGRIAVVTGAASGLGLATSKRFAAEGATVVMVDRRKDAVRQAAEEGGSRRTPRPRGYRLRAPTCCSPTRASPHLHLSAK